MSSKELTRSTDKAGSKQQPPPSAAGKLNKPEQWQAHPAALIQRARLDPLSLTPADMLRLQRAIGNQAVSRIMAGTGQRRAIQRKVGFEYEMGDIRTERWSFWGRNWLPHVKGAVLVKRNGYKLTADEAPGRSQLEIIITEIDETNNAEVTNLINVTVPDVENVIDTIAQNSHNVWTPANQIPNLNGSSWDRFESAQNSGAGINAQLQMTGGIDINQLWSVVSGRRADNYLAANAVALAAAQSAFQQVIGQYTAVNATVLNRAIAAANATPNVNTLAVPHITMIASIVALLANIPIEARAGGNIPYPKATAGRLLARTDFSKILMLTPDEVKAVLTANVLTNLVITTINTTLNPAIPVAAQDFIFPANARFVPGIPQMNQLTIGNWITNLIPTAGLLWGHWQGKDLLTRKNYPGNAAQKDMIESMGGYGSKVDPGDKPIFEFRNLSFVWADRLVDAIRHLIAYLR